MAGKGTSKKTKQRKRISEFLSGKTFSIKLIIIFVAILVAMAGAFLGARHFFLNSQFFTVKEIAVNEFRGSSFIEGKQTLEKLYVGQNIFTVDLKQAQAMIKKDFPELRKVEVRRNLPDELEIDILSRKPIAVIAAGKGIIIDREGVVLAVGGDTGALVKIKGVKFFLIRPSRGEKVKSVILSKALVLLEGLRKKMRKNEKDIEHINVADRNNIMLGIRGVTI
ncbi:cell division protein FtsQ/DivIB, partial [Candidatus Omnitrophota bacterium]